MRPIDPEEAKSIRNVAATIVTILLADCTSAGTDASLPPPILRVAMIATSIYVPSSATARG
jgi:hypothetical protein